MSGLLKDLGKRKKGNARGAGKLAFISAKDEIEEALKQGYFMMDIWSSLQAQKKMPIEYAQFTTYVKKYIKTETQKTLVTPNKDMPIGASETPLEQDSEKVDETKGTQIKTFKHSPSPNKNDLVG